MGTGMQLVYWGAGVEVTRGQTVVRAWEFVCARVREEDKTTACDYFTIRLYTTTTIAAPRVRTPRCVHAGRKNNIRIGVHRWDVEVENGYAEEKIVFLLLSGHFVVFTTVYTRCSANSNNKHNAWHESSSGGC